MRRALKYISILLILPIAVLISFIFIPKVLVVKKSTFIDVPAHIIFNQINDFHNWNFWSELIPDEESFVSYSGGGIGKGGTIGWSNSEAAEIQRFTIISSVPYQSLEIAMDNKEQAFSVAQITLKEKNGKTEVLWESIFKNRGIKSHIFKFDAARKIGRSLTGLAQVSTLWHEQNIPLVELGFIENAPYISIRRQIPVDEAGAEMGNLFEKLLNMQEQAGFTIAGKPFSIYYSLGEERIDVECGFIIEKEIPDFDIAKSGVFEESLCAIVKYDSNYADIESAHDAIRQWIDERNFKLNGAPIETFNNDFILYGQTSEWDITICYPINFE